MTNILLCTLGASWAVIPEAYAFLAPERLPLYQNHPEHARLAALRQEFGLQTPDEIWVCTTQGIQVRKSLQSLQSWIECLPQPPSLQIWQAENTDQLASQQECGTIRELIVRACLKAHHYAMGGQVVLSLAGGRKTMSADMQWAGSLFGCQALLHVISDDARLRASILFKPEPVTLARALPEDLAALITPLIAGQTSRSDVLDVRVDEVGPIKIQDFPLSLPDDNQISVFTDEKHTLSKELTKREKASSRVFGNYLLDISRDESHENWRSLYRLPPRNIDQLRNTPLTAAYRDWLTKMPKADLHRHLGGCLSLADQRKVAQSIWEDLSLAEQRRAMERVKPLLRLQTWDWDWPNYINVDNSRSHYTAALLLHADETQLQHNLWHITEPRIALKNTHRHGFAAYERPGELSGSALLGHPAAIAAYAEVIAEQAVAEGLAYVELRGSPQKYGDGLRFLQAFYRALRQAVASLSTETKPIFCFIVIADRRADESSLRQTIDMAVQAKRQMPEFVVGLDMAGDEKQTKPEQIADLFTPAFEHCLPITIHAGEGEAAESIWQAAYHLHADRIGHGLSLNENPDLAKRFRNRGICLELCPSSNVEVVGFRRHSMPETAPYPAYPFFELWKNGMPLTLCTDNPGISRTTLVDEYLVAAQMSDSRLTLWDTLAVVKQGFVHGFLDVTEKESLLKRCDAKIYDILLESKWML